MPFRAVGGRLMLPFGFMEGEVKPAGRKADFSPGFLTVREGELVGRVGVLAAGGISAGLLDGSGMGAGRSATGFRALALSSTLVQSSASGLSFCSIFCNAYRPSFAGKSDIVGQRTKLPGSQVPERIVRPFATVVSSPRFHLPLCFLQGQEPVFIQALFATAPVESLDKGIFNRLPRLAEIQLHLAQVDPLTRALGVYRDLFMG